MMRSPGSFAVAVRRDNGEIVVREKPWRSIWERLRFLRWPLFRGTVVMAEALVNGMQALNFSAREAMTEEERQKTDSEGDNTGFMLSMTMLLSVVIVIGLFKMLPHLAATYSGHLFAGRLLTVDDIGYHVIDGVVKVSIFIGYVAIIGMFKDIRRVFMYHGAEHMAIYTLEADEELTVENARQKTTLHPRCGTAFLMVVILIFIVVAAASMPFVPEWAKPGPDKPWYTHLIVVLFKLPLLIPVAGLAYEFNRFAGRNSENPFLRPVLWPGLAMQLLTTRQPTDEQLEIALVSLKTALWRDSVGDARPHRDEPVVYENFRAFRDNFEATNATDAVAV